MINDEVREVYLDWCDNFLEILYSHCLTVLTGQDHRQLTMSSMEFF